jgi:hypothetical protein
VRCGGVRAGGLTQLCVRVLCAVTECDHCPGRAARRGHKLTWTEKCEPKDLCSMAGSHPNQYGRPAPNLRGSSAHTCATAHTCTTAQHFKPAAGPVRGQDVCAGGGGRTRQGAGGDRGSQSGRGGGSGGCAGRTVRRPSSSGCQGRLSGRCRSIARLD